MSDASPDQNLPQDLQSFATSLKSLRPVSPNALRDQLLFEAGRTASQSGHRWLWPTLTGSFALLSAVLGGVLWCQSPMVVVQREIIEVPVPQPLPESRTEPEPSPPANPEYFLTNAAKMVKVRNEILRNGVDELQTATVPSSGLWQISESGDELPILPPGTLTSPWNFHFPPHAGGTH